METIALLGATGSLGRALAPRLTAAGYRCRSFSRSPLALQVRVAPDPRIAPTLWDPEEPLQVAAALKGISTAVYLVGMPLWTFAKHLPLTRLVLDAAKAAGVRRLLLVSSNWAYAAAAAGSPVTEEHPLHPPTTKGRVRAEQEALLLAAHTPGTLETAVLRSADFYGPYVEASYLWSAFRAAKNGKIARLLPPVDTPHEFAYVPDVAETLVAMLASDAIWGRAWNLGGSGVTTVRQLTEQIFAEAAVPASYEIPSRWKMKVVRMLNPYVRELGELQYLLETPLLLNDSALAAALGGLRKTDYAAGIAGTLPTVRVGR